MKKLFTSVMLLLLSNLSLVAADSNTKDLPKVLIIGDSISGGYTPYLIEALKESAAVTRHKG
ncbi:MAG: SGNH/GDSL hydrolase family protein, partial [Lentisphaeraceae bacterium]|nr:SGNH/GDSL hydrolase family protein [Lentisphaeraceae bacterium]